MLMPNVWSFLASRRWICRPWPAAVLLAGASAAGPRLLLLLLLHACLLLVVDDWPFVVLQPQASSRGRAGSVKALNRGKGEGGGGGSQQTAPALDVAKGVGWALVRRKP
eukprot:SAG25_NODE_3366_length_1110_cov_5.704253_2_plen_109_part_00